MGYIPWYERMAQEKAERTGKKIKGPTKPGLKDLELVNKIPAVNADQIKKTSYQDMQKQKRIANHLKQQWGIQDKKSSLKVIVPRTETKSPELTGVDRYIIAKKI